MAFFSEIFGKSDIKRAEYQNSVFMEIYFKQFITKTYAAFFNHKVPILISQIMFFKNYKVKVIW